jgi:hypothetical protein
MGFFHDEAARKAKMTITTIDGKIIAPDALRRRQQAVRETLAPMEADREVAAAFRDLQQAAYLEDNEIDVSLRVIRRFERRGWSRLMQRLLTLPPLEEEEGP